MPNPPPARTVWTASDLSRARTSILSEAEHGCALVRATSGIMLVVTAADRLAALEATPRIARLLGAAIVLSKPSVTAADAGELGFAAEWPEPRRRQFADDLREAALHALETRNVEVVDAFLEASRPQPATGVLDPARIIALLSPDDDSNTSGDQIAALG